MTSLSVVSEAVGIRVGIVAMLMVFGFGFSVGWGLIFSPQRFLQLDCEI